MNTQQRSDLANKLMYTSEHPQKSDMVDPAKTSDAICSVLWHLVFDHGYNILITAANSDHHDDSALGPHSHRDGKAVDVWFQNSDNPTDYMPAEGGLAEALARARDLCHEHGTNACPIGLAGAADTQYNRDRLGDSAFSDDGSDHIHLSV